MKMSDTLLEQKYLVRFKNYREVGNSKVEDNLDSNLVVVLLVVLQIDNQDVDYRWLGDLDFEDYPSSLQQDFGVVETEMVVYYGFF